MKNKNKIWDEDIPDLLHIDPNASIMSKREQIICALFQIIVFEWCLLTSLDLFSIVYQDAFTEEASYEHSGYLVGMGLIGFCVFVAYHVKLIFSLHYKYVVYRNIYGGAVDSDLGDLKMIFGVICAYEENIDVLRATVKSAVINLLETGVRSKLIIANSKNEELAAKEEAMIYEVLKFWDPDCKVELELVNQDGKGKKMALVYAFVSIFNTVKAEGFSWYNFMFFVNDGDCPMKTRLTLLRSAQLLVFTQAGRPLEFAYVTIANISYIYPWEPTAFFELVSARVEGLRTFAQCFSRLVPTGRFTLHWGISLTEDLINHLMNDTFFDAENGYFQRASGDDKVMAYLMKLMGLYGLFAPNLFVYCHEELGTEMGPHKGAFIRSFRYNGNTQANNVRMMKLASWVFTIWENWEIIRKSYLYWTAIVGLFSVLMGVFLGEWRVLPAYIVITMVWRWYQAMINVIFFGQRFFVNLPLRIYEVQVLGFFSDVLSKLNPTTVKWLQDGEMKIFGSMHISAKIQFISIIIMIFAAAKLSAGIMLHIQGGA